MLNILKRLGERVFASLVCLVLAPCVFALMVVASLIVLVPGTPLVIEWKGTNK